MDYFKIACDLARAAANQKELPKLFVRNMSNAGHEIYTLEYSTDGRRSVAAEIREVWLCAEDMPAAEDVATQMAKACNLYPELIAALTQCLDALHNETYGNNDTPWIAETKQKAQAVLAKAKT